MPSPLDNVSLVSTQEASNEAMELFKDGMSILNSPSCTTNELNVAVEKLTKAIEMGNEDGAVHLAQLLYFGRDNFEPDYDKCAVILGQCNDPECHFLLGLFHANGLGGKARSIPHMLTYYGLAAERKNEAALLALGWAYSSGTHVHQNCFKARDYYFPVASEMAKKIESERISTYPKVNRLGKEPSEKSSGHGTRDVIDFYQYNADANDPSALLFLGQVFYLGIGGVERDMKLARKYFKHSADLGNIAAVGYLGQMDYYGEGISRPDCRQAYHRFRQASKEKNAIGLNGMGLLYWKGVEVVKDLDEAIKYFKQAVEAEHTEANYNLARVLTEKNPTLNDDKIFACHLAALRGGYVLSGFELAKMNMQRDATCSLAKYLLQNMLEKTLKLSMNDEATKLWFAGHTDAAFSRFLYLGTQGFEVAQYNTAFLLDHIARKSKDPSEAESLRRRAIIWWNYAANHGETQALINLGDYFYHGWGIGKTLPLTAAAFYHKAIDNRSPQAAFNLGYLYQYGIGVSKDVNMAKRYYEQAASLGKSNSQPEAWLPVFIAIRILSIEQRIDRVRRILRVLPPWTIPLATAVIFGGTTILLALLTFGLGRRRHEDGIAAIMPILQRAPRNQLTPTEGESETLLEEDTLEKSPLLTPIDDIKREEDDQEEGDQKEGDQEEGAHSPNNVQE